MSNPMNTSHTIALYRKHWKAAAVPLLLLSLFASIIAAAEASPAQSSSLYGRVLYPDGRPASALPVIAEWSDSNGTRHALATHTLTAGEASLLGNLSLEGYYFFSQGIITAPAGTPVTLKAVVSSQAETIPAPSSDTALQAQDILLASFTAPFLPSSESAGAGGLESGLTPGPGASAAGNLSPSGATGTPSSTPTPSGTPSSTPPGTQGSDTLSSPLGPGAAIPPETDAPAVLTIALGTDDKSSPAPSLAPPSNRSITIVAEKGVEAGKNAALLAVLVLLLLAFAAASYYRFVLISGKMPAHRELYRKALRKMNRPVAEIMSHQAFTFPAESTAKHLIDAMMAKDSEQAILLQGRKPAGLVTGHSLVQGVLSAGGKPENSTAGQCALPLATVQPSFPLLEAARHILRNNFPALAVIKEGRLAGVVTAKELAQAIRFVGSEIIIESRQMVRVRLLAREPVTVEPETPLTEVARVMASKNTDFVIVTEGRQPRGVITSRELMNELAANPHYIGTLHAVNAMSTSIPSLPDFLDVFEASAYLLEKGMEKACVLRGDAFLGTITLTEVLREAYTYIETTLLAAPSSRKVQVERA